MAKVLIVEDDAQISAFIAKSLNARGYRTRVEANGAAALLAAHEDLPDVILMDLAMPILEGQETLHALRHDEHTTHIPVIVLSGRGDDQTLAGAYAGGANAYLTKPPDIQALLTIVERFAAIKPKDAAT